MTTTAADRGVATLRVEDGIGTIRFHHPKGNSLPAALLRRLTECVSEAAADAAARVIVLRSDGDGPFCAGASFDELRAIADERQGKEFFMGFARLILAMTRAPKLIIARVHGRVVGGGVGVVAAADFAVATSDAAVRLSELAVGIGPFVVGPVIERKVGLAHYAALAVDAAAWRDAAWAERVGLFARLAAGSEELDAAVATLAATLARSNPGAMATMKAVFWEGTNGWDELLERRAEMSGALVLSDFSRQAIEAFGRR